MFFLIFLIFLRAGEKELLIADFEKDSHVNCVGGLFGAWNKDPKDRTQFCKDEIERIYGNRILTLTYDVDSPYPAYNGFWMKLNDIDVSEFTHLCFDIKGGKKSTTRFWLELKDKEGRKGKVLVDGIKKTWQTISIPLFLFTMHPEYEKPLQDFKKIYEMVIVFEDRIVTEKLGKIYLDNIKFKKMEKSGYLVIDDFDDGDLISKIGGTEGTWNCNPQDKSQFCKMYFSKDTPTGDGYSIRLRYDIDSPITYDSEYPNIAFNGFYIKLNGLDISGFDYLGVNLKGTTPQVKMEVKFEDGNFEKFIIRGIKRFWDKYYVYLKRKGRVKEIVFVFDKDTPIREGVLYIDNIVLRKREYRRIE